MAEGQQDCFKEEFKRFKKKSTDLRGVLDMREWENMKVISRVAAKLR